MATARNRQRLPTLPDIGRGIGRGVVMHLRELAARRDAWLVLLRNAVPVVGVFAFGWSGGIVVFSYWFDGLIAVSAIIAAMTPRGLRESDPQGHQKRGLIAKVALGVFCWLILVAVLALPYWFVLAKLAELRSPAVWQELTTSPGLWAAFGAVAVVHYWNAFRRGYDTLPDLELRQRCRTDLYLLVLRAIAMFVLASYLAIFLVPMMALVLSYLEIWPERALSLVVGDPKRLHEDPPHLP